MKKILIALIIMLFTLCPIIVHATGEDLNSEQIGALDVNKILDSFNYNGSQILPEFDPNQLLEELSKGNLQIDSKGIFKKVLAYFMKEVNSNMKIIIKVIIIGILCAMLKNLQENFGGSTGEIAFYACYLLMVTLIMLGFKDAISVGQSAIFDMVSFMQAMIPILITLMTTTGNVVSTSALYPVIILVVEVVSSTLGTFMVPIVYLVAALSIISNISDKIQLSKLAALIKTISVWIMGIILTVFVAVVTIEANLGATIDGVTGKAVKFAFSKSIPVVGQTLSDAVETVLGCSVIIRNSVGVVGTILILGIILAPLIKILALMLMYKLAAVLVEPVADARIVRCLNDVGGTLTLLFALVVSVGFMFIIAITALVRTGVMAAAIR